MITSTVSTLNKRNYCEWAIEVETVLFRQVLGKFLTGEMRDPRPPITSLTSGETRITPKAAHDP
jgi:hypothetical protein